MIVIADEFKRITLQIGQRLRLCCMTAALTVLPAVTCRTRLSLVFMADKFKRITLQVG
jgi:hypothetical protein